MAGRTTNSSASRRAGAPLVRGAGRGIGLCLLASAWLLPVGLAKAQAQTWSQGRAQPLLRHITSVDASGELGWPYGAEDLAADGLDVFQADEAGSDLRTSYADSDNQRLWLRAYVAGQSTPPEGVVAYFFVDTDDLDSSGGPARGASAWPPWTEDPTPGGYERAFAVQVGAAGAAQLEGAWGWDAATQAWSELQVNPNTAHAEIGADTDPIRIGPLTRGYLQVDVAHALSGLNASCGGNLFMRVFHDAPAPRRFGDDDAEVAACRPSLDPYGDPVVIRSVACTEDDDCPNGGRCSDGVCLFAYACTGDVDCQADERCDNGACVRVVDGTCDDAADCAGLVCENGSCVACTETGARACADGLACSPDGSCVDPGDAPPPGDGAGPGEGNVRGGAFHCALGAPRASASLLAGWLIAAALALALRRRASREPEASRGSESR